MINKLPLGSYNLSKNFLDKVFFFLKDDFENNLIKIIFIIKKIKIIQIIILQIMKLILLYYLQVKNHQFQIKM